MAKSKKKRNQKKNRGAAKKATGKKKTKRNDEYGEVRWHVTLTNQDGELVAEYELLTMNAY